MKLLIGLLVIGGIAINVWMTHRDRASKRQRGFEVKLNTGGKPVPEKKENDHG